MIVCDDSDETLIRSLLRKMRVYNPVPSWFNSDYFNKPTDNIIEDIFSRRSNLSYFVQAVDFIAHFLYRKEYPKGSLKKHRVEKAFESLETILFKAATSYAMKMNTKEAEYGNKKVYSLCSTIFFGPYNP
jgi:hypothetical protein